MELQEEEVDKEEKCMEKLIENSPKMKDVYEL